MITRRGCDDLREAAEIVRMISAPFTQMACDVLCRDTGGTILIHANGHVEHKRSPWAEAQLRQIDVLRIQTIDAVLAELKNRS